MDSTQELVLESRTKYKHLLSLSGQSVFGRKLADEVSPDEITQDDLSVHGLTI